MKFHKIVGIILTICLGLASQANADFFDKLGEMVDRVTDRAAQKAEERVDDAADEAVDSTFDNTEEAVNCALTDKECSQKKEAQKPPVVHTESSSATMKCLVTDVVCLKQAKSLGKQVEIVDEEDLDKLLCAVTDIECLQKAKRLGKQVEIID
jgi:dsDNA-binding SOS-regulon protein